MTGGFYLASNKTWYDYLKRERSKARYMGLNQEFISPKEVAERHPLIDPSHYLAPSGMNRTGILIPPARHMPFAKSARVHGAQYFTHTPVTGTTQRTDGSWDVTRRADQSMQSISSIAGALGARSGSHAGHQPSCSAHGTPLPLTEKIDGVVNHPTRLPCGIDYEANIYFRQEREGMLLGTYEPKGTPWKVNGTPWILAMNCCSPIWNGSRIDLSLDLNAFRRLQMQGSKMR